ncbi:MAG TPA: hypothetical protein VFZ66_01435 [Herpetosiphonaceae bacterium]
MSDRNQNTGSSGDKPLFQNMDEQERIYAPQQVPGEISDELDERGVGETGRGQDTADRVGVVPVRPDTGINSPVPVPIVTHEREDNEGARDTTQGKG